MAGLPLWKTRKHFTDEKALSPLSLSLSPCFNLSSFCPFFFYSFHLSFLYGRLCGCLICGETNDSDSPNLARYQSHSESNTSHECVSACVHKCVCIRISVYVPRLTHNAPGLSHAVTEGFDLLILSHTFIPTLSLLLSSLRSSLSAFCSVSQTYPRHTHTRMSVH